MVGDKELGRIVGQEWREAMILGRLYPVNFPAFNIIIREIIFAVKYQTLNLIGTSEQL